MTFPSKGVRQRPLVFLFFLLLIGIFLAELALSARLETQTFDEACHIFAGYSYWTRADFGVNPEHPPLVKLLASLPLIRSPLAVPGQGTRDFKIEGFLRGHDFLYSNNADSILFRARMATAVLTLLLGVLVFAASYELFEKGVAFIALFLLVFEPNILSHGALVTTDVGITCLLFATAFAFYRYIEKPRAGRLLLAGLSAGLALAAKHSAVLLAPILIILAGCEIFFQVSSRDSPIPGAQPSWRKLTSRYAGALAAIGLIAVAILWSTYGFRFQIQPAGMQMNPPLVEFTKNVKHPAEARGILAVAHWRLLPEAYLFGWADVLRVTESSATYLFGKAYPSGRWFYFPAAFVIKSTLPVLILIFIFLPLAFRQRWIQGNWSRETWRKAAFQVIPPAIYFAAAMRSGLNIGVRHILPVFPFVLILAAVAAWRLAKTHKVWAYTVVLLLIFHAASSLHVFPVYISYSNELWGGPSNTYKVLTDSNVDWGQQLQSTARYLELRGVKNCWFAYFADVASDPAYYGIPCKPLTTISSMWLKPIPDVPTSVDGTVLISAGVLSGYELGPGQLNPYAQFQKLKPTAVIENGVFVFDGHFDTTLASALNHVGKVWEEASKGDLNQAVAEAQTAVNIAPDSVKAQAMLGDMSMAVGHTEQGRAAYEKALALSKTLEPEYRNYWESVLKTDLQ